MGAMVMVGYALMQPGDHHGDEVPDDAAGKWLALVRENQVVAFEVVEVAVSLVHDNVTDDGGGPPTGRRVEIVGRPPSANVIALMRGPGLVPGPVTLAQEHPRPLFPGDRQFLTFGDSYVELFGVGTSDDEGRIESYGLLTSGGALLPKQAMALETGAGVPSVQLAGDFDHDGRLDFLVATGTHYNVHELTLFLSNGVEQGVRPVAVWRTVGC
jgi:hypothetical protein